MDALSHAENLTALARRAGREANDAALEAYRSVVRCDWDARMPSAADAFWLWADGVSEDDWGAAERAFVEGWQDAIDAR